MPKKSQRAASGFPATARQRVFCEEYVASWNVVRAAKKAGYSESYANTQAHELVSRLMPYMAQLQGQKEKALAPVTATSISDAMGLIAFANIGDFHEVYVDEASQSQRVRGRPWKDLTREQRAVVEDYWYDPHGNLRYKLHDKKHALYLLGKYLGMFNEKLIIERRNVDVVARFDFSHMTMEELKQLEATLAKARGGEQQSIKKH